MPDGARSVVTVMGMMSPVIMIAGASQPHMIAWFFGAYVALGVVATLGAFLFEKKKKGKSEDFTEELSENAASADGAADAQQKARMDDMRKEFERGIGIYKEYGKDIYSLPWFVVVGESGSGKTEAIRNSDIGFPEKLQDYWQGSGGTLSMHWWFTNRAVILDTAGRLFVQDGQSATEKDNQWSEFLQMLRKNRPECPSTDWFSSFQAPALFLSLTPLPSKNRSWPSTLALVKYPNNSKFFRKSSPSGSLSICSSPKPTESLDSENSSAMSTNPKNAIKCLVGAILTSFKTNSIPPPSQVTLRKPRSAFANAAWLSSKIPYRPMEKGSEWIKSTAYTPFLMPSRTWLLNLNAT